jgi:N-acetylmuramoyl-L-alanine amidase
VPLTEIAYCSNTANDYTVSIEVCHPDDTGKFDDATMESLEALVAWLCETFDLDPAEDVIRHYDVTGKICPKYFVDYPEKWEDFHKDVKKAIKILKK